MAAPCMFPLSLRRYLVPLLAVVAGLATCTDGDRSTDPIPEGEMRLAVNPVFNPALAAEGANEINRIRITVYLQETDSILGQADVDVDPTQNEWTLDVSVLLPNTPTVAVTVTVELMSVSGEEEQVEWSGKTGSIVVAVGLTPKVENVPVVRGGLGNLTVTGVSIQEPISSIMEGDTLQLSAQYSNSDPENETQVFWTSLDTDVATVSDEGEMIGVAPGTALMVATAGAYADTSSAVIRPRPVEVELDPDSLRAGSLGEVFDFSAAVLDIRGDPVPGETVAWSVEAPEILESLGGGSFRALSRGTTVVTATQVNEPHLTASALAVVEQEVTAVEVFPAQARLNATGDHTQFEAVAYDGNENPVEGMTFSWSVSDPAVATIDGSGLATANGNGTTTVFAEASTEVLSTEGNLAPLPGLVGEATLIVEQIVERVEVTPTSATLSSIGASHSFTASAFDPNGNPVEGASFSWTTSNPAVAIVSFLGEVTAVSNGTATISAVAQGRGGQASVTVSQIGVALQWVNQPPDVRTRETLNPAPSVEVQDALGTRATNWNGSISLLPHESPGGALSEEMGGTATATASQGLAIFSDLHMTASGDYVLEAEATGLTSAMSSPFTIQDPVLDLAVTKTVDTETPGEGDRVTFTVTAQNNGDLAATGIRVKDPLPSGLTLAIASMDPPAGWDSSTGTWTLATLGPGATATLTLEVDVDPGTAGTTLTNTAYVEAFDQADTIQANDTAQAVVTPEGVDIAITKTVDNPGPEEGEQIVYTVAVGNLGPADATDVMILEVLPPGLGLDSVQTTHGTWNLSQSEWTIPTLAAGDADTLRLFVTVGAGTAGTTLANLAILKDVYQTDTNAANDEAQVDITVDQPDLELLKTLVSGSIGEGYPLEFRIDVIQNSTTAQATGVQVTDNLPAGLTYVSDSTSQGTYDSGTGIWALGSLPAGVQTYSLWITAEPDAGTAETTLTNTATITAVDQGDSSPGDNTGSASVTIPAIPAPASYNTAGNTELIAGAYPPPSTPHVTAANNVLAGTSTITVTSLGPFASTNGGTVVMEADGDFSYTPAPGDTGPDTFTYTVNTGLSAIVTVNMGEMVWYVDNSNPTAGTGVSNDPFDNTSMGMEYASGDRVFIWSGDGTSTGYTDLSLSTGQIVEGEAMGLTVAPFGELVPAGGPLPKIASGSGVCATLSSGSTLRGLILESCYYNGISANSITGATVEQVQVQSSLNGGISLVNTTGTLTFTGMSVSNVNELAVYVSGGDPTFTYSGDVSTSIGEGVWVSGTTGGSVTFDGGTISGGRIDVQNAQGPVTFTSPVVVTNPSTGPGVTLNNNTALVTFADLSVTTDGEVAIDADSNSGGLNITTGTVNAVDAQGLEVRNTPFTADFSSFTVSYPTLWGPGMELVTTTPGSVTFGLVDISGNSYPAGMYMIDAGTVSVTNPASSVVMDGMTAIHAVGTTLNMDFATVSSLTPGFEGTVDGLTFINCDGVFTASSGSITSPSTGSPAGVRITGGTLDFTYNGTITNTDPDTRSVYLTNRTGGTVRFGGPITDSGRGIQIGGVEQENLGGLVSFDGTLTLTGNGSYGLPLFYAYGDVSNGQLAVTGTDNTIATSAPIQALEINNTTINPEGVTFETIEISAAGDTLNGVVVKNTGTGPFTISGDPVSGWGSGGIIQDVDWNEVDEGWGMIFENVQDVSLSYVKILNTRADAIQATNVNNLTLYQSVLSGAGDWDNYNGLDLVNVTGTFLVQEDSLYYIGGDCIDVYQDVGTFDLRVDGSYLAYCGGEYSADLVNIDAQGSGVVNGFVENGSTLEEWDEDGIDARATGSAQVDLLVDGSSASNTFSQSDTWTSGYGIKGYANSSASLNLDVLGGASTPNVFNILSEYTSAAIYLSQIGGATVTFQVDRNTITSSFRGAIFYADTSSAGGSIQGTVTNNDINTQINPTLHFDMRWQAQGTFLVEGNTLHGDSTAGHAVLASAGQSSPGRIDFIARNNTVTTNVLNTTGRGIEVQPGNTGPVCTAIDGNDVTGVAGNGIGITATGSGDLHLETLDPDPFVPFLPNDGTVGEYLDGVNAIGNGAVVSTPSSFVVDVAEGTCYRPFTPLPSGTADLEVRKTASVAGAYYNDPFDYRVVVRNRGPGSATGVQLVDSLYWINPPVPGAVRDLAWVASGGTTWTPNAGTGAGLWNVGTLAPGDSATLTISTEMEPEVFTAEIDTVFLVVPLAEADPDLTNNWARAGVDNLGPPPLPVPQPEPSPVSDESEAMIPARQLEDSRYRREGRR